MASTSSNNSPSLMLGMTTRRRTRNSMFVDELAAPPLVRRILETRRGITHAAGTFVGHDVTWWCCRRSTDPDMITSPGAIVTCLSCAQCKGCPACRDNFITDKSLQMGKWETHDRRKLYPFEMDNQHLMNAIAKLERDKERFKRYWRQWLDVMEDEAQKRGLL